MSSMNEDDFSTLIDGVIDDATTIFDEDHKAALNELSGLSEAQIKAISPGVTSQADYDALMQVVRDATTTNTSNAALRERIIQLGTGAVEIAKSVSSLARLFV